MRGRPLAFLVLVLFGWTFARYNVLSGSGVWPLADTPVSVLVPSAQAAPVSTTAAAVLSESLANPANQTMTPLTVGSTTGLVAQQRFTMPPAAPSSIRVPVAAVASIPGAAPASITTSPAAVPPGLPAPASSVTRPGRWSGSAWAIVRGGGGGSLLSPLLGGSQTGVRIAYRVDSDGDVVLFARAATPLQRGPAELAAGAQWRPTRAPVTIYAEVRATRGQAAPAAGVFGGGAVELPSKFRLEGYGQAGVIKRGGTSGFGDAQVRLVRALGPTDVGIGAWGAAQRGARRVDIGPSIALPIPVKPLALRLTLDWRQRIAGNARPASGPALSLGADF